MGFHSGFLVVGETHELTKMQVEFGSLAAPSGGELGQPLAIAFVSLFTANLLSFDCDRKTVVLNLTCDRGTN